MLGYAIALATAIYMVFFSDDYHIMYSSIINKTIATLIVAVIGLGAYRLGGIVRRGVPSDVATSDQGCLIAIPLILVWKLALNLVFCVVGAFIATSLYFWAFGVTGQDLSEAKYESDLAESSAMLEGWKATHRTEIKEWEASYPIAYGPGFAKTRLSALDDRKEDRIFTPEQRKRMLEAKLLWEASLAQEATSSNKEQVYALRSAADRSIALLKNDDICFHRTVPEKREWYRCSTM